MSKIEGYFGQKLLCSSDLTQFLNTNNQPFQQPAQIVIPKSISVQQDQKLEEIAKKVKVTLKPPTFQSPILSKSLISFSLGELPNLGFEQLKNCQEKSQMLSMKLVQKISMAPGQQQQQSKVQVNSYSNLQKSIDQEKLRKELKVSSEVALHLIQIHGDYDNAILSYFSSFH